MYTAAAGMAAQQTRLDAVANDLANVDTTGYKHVRLSFRDLVYDSAAGYGAAKGVTIGAGSAATPIGRSVTQGALQNTGNALDVAITGQGYIQVKLADGRVGLTRDGALAINKDGKLALHTGELVEPPVTVPAGANTDHLSLAPDGALTLDGRSLGKLTLVDVPAPAALDGGPDNTFLATKGSGAIRAAAKSTFLQQGVLEGSNVDQAQAMTDMIEAQRAFELASKAISTQDQILEIANQVKK
jgi:flagellar basal-body rod protein FlgG